MDSQATPITPSSRRRSGSDIRLRQQSIGVRVTEEERERIGNLATRAGCSTADWLRRAALRRAVPKPRGGLSHDAAEALRRITGEIGRVGNNLNQIAHRLNTTALIGMPELPAETALYEIADALDGIRIEIAALRGSGNV